MILDDLNTCDKHGDRIYFKLDECPVCKDELIENLQAENTKLKALCKEADDYLNLMPAPTHNKICHGSILHGQFAAAWRDFDAREHDGRPCSAACMGHRSHPCEKCGRQWPVKHKGED